MPDTPPVDPPPPATAAADQQAIADAVEARVREVFASLNVGAVGTPSGGPAAPTPPAAAPATPPPAPPAGGIEAAIAAAVDKAMSHRDEEDRVFSLEEEVKNLRAKIARKPGWGSFLLGHRI